MPLLSLSQAISGPHVKKPVGPLPVGVVFPHRFHSGGGEAFWDSFRSSNAAGPMPWALPSARACWRNEFGLDDMVPFGLD